MTTNRASKAASNALYYANRHDARAPRPACMTEPEYALWLAGNGLTHGWLRADSPCRDCTPLFHADMVAGGMCDGAPGPGPDGKHYPRPLPMEFHEKSTAELRAIRAVLRVALRRAQWREYRLAKRAVTGCG